MRFTKSKARHSCDEVPQEKLWQLEKVASLGSFFNIFTAFEGIPSEDGYMYVIFIGIVNVMARKCMINVRTETQMLVCFGQIF